MQFVGDAEQLFRHEQTLQEVHVEKVPRMSLETLMWRHKIFEISSRWWSSATSTASSLIF